MRDDCDFTKSYLFIPFFTFWVFRSFIQLLVIHSLFPFLPFSIDVVPVTVARNLGTWFDSNLNLQEQIHKTCKAGFFHLYNIRRIRILYKGVSTNFGPCFYHWSYRLLQQPSIWFTLYSST